MLLVHCHPHPHSCQCCPHHCCALIVVISLLSSSPFLPCEQLLVVAVGCCHSGGPCHPGGAMVGLFAALPVPHPSLSSSCGGPVIPLTVAPLSTPWAWLGAVVGGAVSPGCCAGVVTVPPHFFPCCCCPGHSHCLVAMVVMVTVVVLVLIVIMLFLLVVIILCHLVSNNKMKRKKTYMWPKRWHRHLMGPFFCLPEVWGPLLPCFSHPGCSRPPLCVLAVCSPCCSLLLLLHYCLEGIKIKISIFLYLFLPSRAQMWLQMLSERLWE